MLSYRRGGFHVRHAALRTYIWHLTVAAGHHAACEVVVGGSQRPADVLLGCWIGAGPLAVDVSVVHPLAPSVPFQSVQGGEVALKRVKELKIAKYAEVCQSSNMNFTPFVLTTFGRLGSGSAAFLADLIKGLPQHDLTPAEKRDQTRQYHQQLQLALKREVARMLLLGACQEQAEANTHAELKVYQIN